MLRQFYKLGAAQAVQDFTSWLDGGMDNPTTEAPAARYAKTAVARMVDKLAASKKQRSYTPMYTPKKGTRFKAMVTKLKKKKRAGGR